MTGISAALVKELRDQTGAPMMDCKRALVDTNGDIEAAKRLLRERGMASAEKRAGRATTEGKVGYRIGDEAKRGTMVAVGCETEPVSNNDEFLAFAKKVLEAVEADGPDAGGAASTRSGRRSPASSARTSSSQARHVSRRSTAGSSRATRTRRRTSSACSCRFAAAQATSPARSRCTSQPRPRSGSAGRTSRRTS